MCLCLYSENIKVPYSVIVSGLSGSQVDEEVFDYLKQFLSISRLLEIPQSESEYSKQAIVEYTCGDVVEILQDDSPLHRPCVSNPIIIHHVTSLSSVYRSGVGSAAFNYLLV